MDTLGDLERRLLNDFQRDLPLTPAPFAEIAARLGAGEQEVIGALRSLRLRGAVSRVGAVFRPRTLGASTLAAMAVPAGRLEAVASVVNGYRAVNHNYEREHPVNLWFVVSASTEPELEAIIADIARRSGFPVMSLPLLEDYHIDLGFTLWSTPAGPPIAREGPTAGRSHVGRVQGEAERRVSEAVQGGLPLVPRPFQSVARRVGLTEAEVMGALEALVERGIIKRLGVIVRHHELGYQANAMVVWDLPDARARALGPRIARFEFVTLCYRRARHLPEWPYNLYCMIHGRERETVRDQIRHLVTDCELAGTPCEVLFSRRRFKQRGALYPDGSAAAA